jgi:hypothetical protein
MAPRSLLSVEVRAIDDAGRREAAPARHEFTVDTRVPETTITDGPRGVATITG